MKHTCLYLFVLTLAIFSSLSCNKEPKSNSKSQNDTIIENEVYLNSKNDNYKHKDTMKCKSEYTRNEMISLFITNDFPSQKAIINKFGHPDTLFIDTFREPCSSFVYKCGNKYVAFHYELKTNECLGYSSGIFMDGKFIRRTGGMSIRGKNKE